MTDAFQTWWHEHGQYVRAGGGQYEISFAFAAWNAALEAAAKLMNPYDDEETLGAMNAGSIRALKGQA